MTATLSRTRALRTYHATPEYYTPRWLMARIRAFLGDDFYDPCPASYGKPVVNGLAERWHGAVYCNPPYGAEIGPWIRKAVTERGMREVILLIPAYTDTKWFQPLFEGSSICFMAGRVRFERMGVAQMQAPHPSVLVYRGKRHKAFADAFCDLGTVMRTYRRRREQRPALWEVVA